MIIGASGATDVYMVMYLVVPRRTGEDDEGGKAGDVVQQVTFGRRLVVELKPRGP